MATHTLSGNSWIEGVLDELSKKVPKDGISKGDVEKYLAWPHVTESDDGMYISIYNHSMASVLDHEDWLSCYGVDSNTTKSIHLRFLADDSKRNSGESDDTWRLPHPERFHEGDKFIIVEWRQHGCTVKKAKQKTKCKTGRIGDTIMLLVDPTHPTGIFTSEEADTLSGAIHVLFHIEEKCIARENREISFNLDTASGPKNDSAEKELNTKLKTYTKLTHNGVLVYSDCANKEEHVIQEFGKLNCRECGKGYDEMAEGPCGHEKVETMLERLVEWENNATEIIKDLDIKSLIQKDREYLESHNLSGRIQDYHILHVNGKILECPQTQMNLDGVFERNEANFSMRTAADRKKTLDQNVRAIRASMKFFTDNVTDPRWRINYVNSDGRFISGRAAWPWNKMSEKITRFDFDHKANLPTRIPVNDTNYKRKTHTGKRKQSNKRVRFE